MAPQLAEGDDRLQVPSLVDEIARRLRELILAAAFTPGERLIEEQLAERFGVSRPPVREALRMLSRDGLVVGVPRKGYSVVRLTPEDVRHVYDLRFALERTAIELGVPVTDPSRSARVREALSAMRRPGAQADHEEMLRANSAFHEALVALPGNRWLDDAYRNIAQQLELCMAMNLRFREQLYHDPQDTVRRHEVLAELIDAGVVPDILDELSRHGDRSFMDRLDELIDPPTTRT